MEMHSYMDIRDRIDTGDLVLFSGKGGVSAGIKWFTRSSWSHVGMALRLPEWDMVLLWESTVINNVKDVEEGRVLQGVQLTPLSERLARYDGDVAIRHLEVERTPAMASALRQLREQFRGRPYEGKHIELLKSAYDGPFGRNHEDLSSLFCSEMVAEAYQAMDLLPPRPASNEYTPRDFSAAGKLKLVRGSLGPEVIIRKPR
jgi:hypothetical protein